MTHATRKGFTLIEIMVSLLILVVGLTAALSLVFLGMDWSQQVRNNTLAIETARSVFYDASMIDPTKTNDDALVSGYLNGFYVIRETGPMTGSAAPVDPTVLYGKYSDIRVRIYTDVLNGDETKGTLVWDFAGKVYRTQ